MTAEGEAKAPEMSAEETEMTKKIGELGDKIKEAKAAGKPKEEWDPILKEMIDMKVGFDL